MLHHFLQSNREELIALCRAKTAQRGAPAVSGTDLPNGVELFIEQLIEMLGREAEPGPGSRLWQISSDSPEGDTTGLAGIDAAAAKHGSELLARGFSIDQVVHDYGCLCQAITELASTNKVQISVANFKTLNRCLDNAIAAAVEEYAHQRDFLVSRQDAEAMHERLGRLADELRTQLDCAVLAASAMRIGAVGAAGATASSLERSLERLREIVDRSLAEIRLSAGMTTRLERVAVADLISEIRTLGEKEAQASGRTLVVGGVDGELAMQADRALLSSAVGQLLRDALRRSSPAGKVHLGAHATVTHVSIDVEGEPASPPPADVATQEQRGARREAGADHNLMRAAEAAGGRLRLRNSPGGACIASIDFRRQW